MNQKLRPSLEDLRAIVGGFHPQERFVLTFKVCAGVSELAALGDLAKARQLKVLPDSLLPAREGDDSRWECVRVRQRVIRILPHFEWQAFERAFGSDYSKIENIEPFL